MNNNDFDNYGSSYNKILGDQHKKFGDIEYYSEYKIKIIKNILDNSKELNILEFGCGVGRNLPYISKYFPNSKIFGFDISKKSISIAKESNKTVEFLDSFEDKNEFFDLIFISGVYHHIEPKKRQEVTNSLYNLLKKEALLVVFEHNPYNPLTMKMVNTCEFDKEAVVIKKRELSSLFLKSNFKIKETSYSLFFPPKLKKFNFLEKYLTWCPIGGQYYIVVEK